jgi:hypothetical protein
VRGYPCAAGRLLRGCTPVCNDHFQCLLKPQKSAILNLKRALLRLYGLGQRRWRALRVWNRRKSKAEAARWHWPVAAPRNRCGSVLARRDCRATGEAPHPRFDGVEAPASGPILAILIRKGER